MVSPAELDRRTYREFLSYDTAVLEEMAECDIGSMTKDNNDDQ